jgi:hypothetical protein
MRRPDLGAIGRVVVVSLVIGAAGVTGATSARAQTRRDAGAAGAKRASDAGVEAGALPAAAMGLAPPLTSDDDTLPAGHPQVPPGDGDDGQGDVEPDANPHAHAGKAGAMPGVFEPPPDTETPDTSLAPGTIEVELRDADDHPLANESITLGMLINSIAKGDSRKHLQATTNDKGLVVFPGLETAQNIAYRVSSGFQGGSFAATPFQLGSVKAMKVVLHVYPVVHDLGGALIVCEATVAAELRDDRFQVEEALTVYNLGRTAWQPDDVRMALPEGATAFNAQQTMSDQGVDEVKGTAKLRGTFPPGRHPVEFRWQIPWSGDQDVDFDVGLPPHVAIARVMMPATSTIKLSAAGFPPTDVRRDEQGQSFLVTEKRLRPDDAKINSLAIGIHDLPTPGPGKWVATTLAGSAVFIGLGLAFGTGRKRSRDVHDRNQKISRDVLLEELAGLERARVSGEVGPRTYERTRRELLVGLARALGGST